jgi:transposase
MVKPYSIDLRERVVAAVGAGEPCRAVANTFGVSVASVVKWSQRKRRTGSVAPDKIGGHKRLKLEPERDWIIARLAEQPDLTVRKLADELAERGIIVGHLAVWNLLRREKLSHKKKRIRQRAGSS